MLKEAIPLEALFTKPDRLALSLTAPEEPHWTNGRWDGAASRVRWEFEIPGAGGPPVISYATWVEPDEAAQRARFGAVLLRCRDLFDYAVWYSGLTAAERRAWEHQLAALDPARTSAAVLARLDPPSPDSFAGGLPERLAAALASPPRPDSEGTPMRSPLPESLASTRWTGSGELWLDPTGNRAETGPCTLAIEADRIRYTWERGGTTHAGEFVLDPAGARWSDTFHQPQPTRLRPIPAARGLLAFEYDYPAPPDPDWGWRIHLSRRPGGELVLQMTNITSWGEEARAVRMVFTRAE